MFRLFIISLAILLFGIAQAQIPTDSVDGTGTDSVDGTGTDSVDGTGTDSVDGTGLESVDGTGLNLRRETPQATAPRSYVVQAGDTLGTIAMQFLGDSGQWQQIFEANRGVLSDANTVPAGITLTIPSGN